VTGSTAAPAAPRRLIVLRHGQTEENAAGVFQGQLDSHLSEHGREQVRAAAVALADRGVTRVVASDLRRAAETGREVARVLGLELGLDERFREIHVGEWTGVAASEVRERYPADWERLERNDDFPRGGTGETVAAVATRTRAGVDDLLADLPAGECAVIATHGLAGRVLVAALVELDQHAAWLHLASLGNCHWAELVEGRLGWRIQTWNASA